MDLLNRSDKKHQYASIFKDFIHAVSNEMTTVSVVLHWARGQIHVEKIPAGGKKKISSHVFLGIYPDIEEDVRYVLLDS